MGFGLAALIAAGAGCLCKETLVTLPLTVLVAELCFFARGQPLRKRKAWLTMLILAGLGLGRRAR